MIGRFSRTLLLLSAICLPAFTQDASIVRIGVSVVSGGSLEVSDVQLRNEVVKVINEPKTDKKFKMSLVAVALEEPAGGRAMAEATGKDCTYILYVYLRPLQINEQYQSSYTDTVIVNRSLATATLEYIVRPVNGGVAYAAGTGLSDPVISPQEAILQAARRAGEAAIAEMAKGSNRSRVRLDEVTALEKMTSSAVHDAYVGENFCAWLPSNLAHADALLGACEYALTLPQKMPNFMCRQQTSRFQGPNKVPSDLITANVRYENGDESYRDLLLNGKPVQESVATSAGLWSSGQFEGNLRDVFHSGNHALFSFSGKNLVADHPAWVFTYQIAQQIEPLWQLRANGKVIAPAYGGELWIDEKTGDLLRFTSKANGLPADFPMQSAEVLIDYENVEFGDGTAFVLPVTTSVATRFQGFEPTRNLVQLRGCHKFRATAYLLTAEESAGKPSEGAGTGNPRDRALDESETMYAILREQAIREDAQQLEIEQQQELKWATIGALAKLATLERERKNNGAREIADADTSRQPNSAGPPVTTFRASIKLVPVSVVVRDSKGRAVGSLAKTDFQLFDERKPQAIGSFSVEKAEQGAQQQPSSGAGPAAQTGNQAAIAANNVAYVFDDVHSTYEDIENARDAATRHLTEMRPQDQAAVFTTSGVVSLSFTTDRERLRLALHALKSHARVTTADCPQLSYYMADMILNRGDGDATEKAVADAMDCTVHGMGKRDPAEMEKARQLTMAKSFEVLSEGRVESANTLRILQDVVQTTAPIAGRRSIVLVSPGFLAADFDAQDQATALIDRAVQAGVIVNTLDVRGVLTTSVSAKALDLTNTGQFDRQETTARAALMADIAYGTGGTFFHNNNDLDLGFRQTADMPEYVYVLGFSPQKLDGKFHKLKVKVSGRDKLIVQAREGYYALKQTSVP